MKFIILLLSIYITLKSIGYSFFEYQQKNKKGSAFVIFVALLQLIFTNIVIFVFNR